MTANLSTIALETKTEFELFHKPKTMPRAKFKRCAYSVAKTKSMHSSAATACYKNKVFDVTLTLYLSLFTFSFTLYLLLDA